MSNLASARAQLARTSMARGIRAYAETLASQAAKTTESEAWLHQGVLWQVCKSCETINYPARALCSNCLEDALEWQTGSDKAQVQGTTTVHISMNELYKEGLPWYVAYLSHDEGPGFYAFVEAPGIKAGEAVSVFTLPDVIDEPVFLAVRPGEDAPERAAMFSKKLSVSTEA